MATKKAMFGTGVEGFGGLRQAAPPQAQSDMGGLAFARMPAAQSAAPDSVYGIPTAQAKVPTLWTGAPVQQIEYGDVRDPVTFGSADEVRAAAQKMRQAGEGLTGEARGRAVAGARPQGALRRAALNVKGYDPSAGMAQKGKIGYTTVREAMNPISAAMFSTTGDLGIQERQERNAALAERYKGYRPKLEEQRAQIPAWQQLKDLQSKGVAYKNPQGGSESQMDNILREMSRWGINDLQQVGTTTDASGKTVFFNRMTGQQLPELIGSSSGGEGFTEYKWMALPGGGAIPVSKWEESSDRGAIAKALSIGAGLLMPAALGPLAGALGGATGALGATGSAIGAGALYGAASSALPAAITGGNMGKSLLGGAIGGGIGAGVGALNPAAQLGIQNQIAQQAANAAISGGLRGGATSALQGQNIGQGALGGALAGGIGGAISPVFGKGAFGQLAAQQVTQPIVKQAKRLFGVEGQG